MATFRKLTSGKWRAEIARQGVRKSASFATKGEAKDWAARQETLILETVKAEPAQKHGTFGDLMNRYANEVSPTHKGERWEILRLKRMRDDEIAKTLAVKLVPEQFAQWRDARLRSVASGTVIREMQLMSAVLNVARREWGLPIAANPLSDVRRPSKPHSRDRLPTVDELGRIRLVAGEDLSFATARAFHAFLFALETAMRAGEIVELTWDRVDLDRRVATLLRTKNGRSRQVPLSQEAVNLLKALPAADPIFGLDSRQIDVLWRKSRDKAGVEGLTFHDSRHAAITRLSKRLDVLALARMVGHTDLRMLQVYYNETAEELAKRLD